MAKKSMPQATEPGDCWTVESASSEQTQALGRNLGHSLLAMDWVGLSGDLGAGKTCFVQGVALGGGVDEQCAVTSPTFTILQSYPGHLPVHHLDLYRLGDYDELIEIGYDELLEGDGVCLVEWWDRIAQARPASGLLLEISIIDEQRRSLTFEGFGPRGRDLLKDFRTSWQEENKS